MAKKEGKTSGLVSQCVAEALPADVVDTSAAWEGIRIPSRRPNAELQLRSHSFSSQQTFPENRWCVLGFLSVCVTVLYSLLGISETTLQYVNEYTWLYSNKALFTKTSGQSKP